MAVLFFAIAGGVMLVLLLLAAFDLGAWRAGRRYRARWEQTHPGMSWADWQAMRNGPPKGGDR
jgi:hypothetical protein